jgi:hypothetical protein
MRDKILSILERIKKHELFLLEHLEADSDDFTGYYTKKSINEDSFHIPFDRIKRDLNELLKQDE